MTKNLAIGGIGVSYRLVPINHVARGIGVSYRLVPKNVAIGGINVSCSSVPTNLETWVLVYPIGWCLQIL